jgi:hypothetical protein
VARPTRGADSIRVQGLRDLNRALRDLPDDGDGQRLLKQANYNVAEFVVGKARPAFEALNGETKGQASKVARTLRPAKNQLRGVVALGNAQVPWAAGVEFGAIRNKRRLVKNTGGRATIVRDEERLGRVIKNVQAQRNINTGQQVRVTRIIRGWNQFLEWRGNREGAGYALFPTMRKNMQEIVDFYGDELDKVMKAAFPD